VHLFSGEVPPPPSLGSFSSFLGEGGVSPAIRLHACTLYGECLRFVRVGEHFEVF
jgi:hypothetical protein